MEALYKQAWMGSVVEFVLIEDRQSRRDREEGRSPCRLSYFDCNPFYPSGWPRRGGNVPVAVCQW